MLVHLADKNIILASKSPRRQELLKGLDIDFSIRTKDVEEVYPSSLDLYKVPEYLSELKAETFKDDLKDNDIVITSDTVVILNNAILGKPKGIDGAKKMLSDLSGQIHEVITGVTLMSRTKTVTFNDTTRVFFRPLTHKEINYYVDKYQPLDKAGAYGIQEWIGHVGIIKIEGCYFNVMGLPLQKLYQELMRF